MLQPQIGRAGHEDPKRLIVLGLTLRRRFTGEQNRTIRRNRHQMLDLVEEACSPRVHTHDGIYFVVRRGLGQSDPNSEHRHKHKLPTGAGLFPDGA